MKKVLFISLILAFSTLSCKKVKDLLRFDINYSTNLELPSNQTIIGDLLPPIFSPDISANTEQTFKNQGTRADLVKEIRVKSVKLTITNPPGETFGFLKSISIHIADGNKQNAKRIAFLDNVPANAGNIITLNTDDSVLIDSYLKADKFTIKTEYTIRGTNPRLDIQADMVFSVLADPF